MPPNLYMALAKIGGVILAMTIMVVVAYHKGSEATQQEWDAAIMQQSLAAGESMVKNAENTAALESRYQRTIDEQARRVRQLTKEVRTYATSQTKKCELSPEFVSVFDAASRLHDADAVGVPAAADPSGAAALLSEAPITDVEVLEAHQLSAVELANLWETYAALRDWVRSSHAIAIEGAGR